MIYLLDVNLLLALCDPRHSHHDLAHGWFESRPPWATCPLTENAFIRISSKPVFGGDRTFASGQLELLRTFCSVPQHSFWPDSLSVLEPDVWEDRQTLASSQLTDLYLLALAVKNGGKLASFDRRIPAHLVRGGKRGLLILAH